MWRWRYCRGSSYIQMSMPLLSLSVLLLRSWSLCTFVSFGIDIFSFVLTFNAIWMTHCGSENNKGNENCELWIVNVCDTKLDRLLFGVQSISDCDKMRMCLTFRLKPQTTQSKYHWKCCTMAIYNNYRKLDTLNIKASRGKIWPKKRMNHSVFFRLDSEN